MRKNNLFTKGEADFFLNQSPIFTDEQIKIISKKTPESEIEIKTDASGFKYKSVKSSYVKTLVTMVTGGNYDFVILSREFIPSTKECLVHAKLTINGRTRDQFGQHYCDSQTGTGKNSYSNAINIGYGYKSAASDGFKKCAAEFGFCWDIYGQEKPEKQPESKKTNHQKQTILERLDHFLSECVKPSEIESVYERFIQNEPETEEAKEILKTHMERVC